MTEPPTLTCHLAAWLGAWPGTTALDVVGSARREEPGWDGRVEPVLGVLTPAHGVLSVTPALAGDVRHALAGPAADARRAAPTVLAALVGAPVVETVLRFTAEPAALPDAGAWLRTDAPGLPSWLRVFTSPVLVALDDRDRYLAGVGLKRHDGFGHELAVGTEPAARGAGLARRLVAQAARAVLAAGAIPTYQHEPGNRASARVAETAGFPDRGWRMLRLAEPADGPTPARSA